MKPITIAICTRDRPHHLQRCLEALTAECRASGDILVIASAPTGSAEKEITDAFGVRCITQPRPGLNVARNTALRYASGNLIAFIDDDAQVQPGWLAAITTAFTDPAADCVTGRIQSGPLTTPAQHYFETRFSFDRGPQADRFTAGDRRGWYPLHPYHLGAGCNMAFRRRVFDQIGLFDEALDAGTATGGGGDLDIFRRLLLSGMIAVYAPDARVIHEHRADSAASRRQFFAYGKTLTALMTKIWFEKPASRRTVLTILRQQGILQLRQLVGRLARRENSIPLRWISNEIRGNLAGGFAYLRARHRAKNESWESTPGAHIARINLAAVDSQPDIPIPEGKDCWLFFHDNRQPISSRLLAAPGPELSGARIRRLAGELPPPYPAAKKADPEEPLDVALIICTRGRPYILTRCLESLAAVRPSLTQLIIVDNSPDPTGSFAAAAAMDPVLIHEPIPGLCRARNRGLEAATAEIVVFIDDDVLVDAGWWSGLLAAYNRQKQVAGVMGLVLPLELDATEQLQFEFGIGGLSRGFTARTWAGPEERNAAPRLGVGANMSFRRGDLIGIGGFDPALDPGSPAEAGGDIDIFYRLLAAGKTLAYVPEMLVWHRHRHRAGAVERVSKAYGRGTAAAYTKWGVRGDGRAARALLGFLLRYYPRLLWQAYTLEHTLPPRFIWLGWLAGWRGPWSYFKGRWINRRTAAT